MMEEIDVLVVKDILADEPVADVFIKCGHIAEDGIHEDVPVRRDVELLAGTNKLTQFPLVEQPFQPFVAEQVTQHMLQPRALAGEIAVEHLCHHALEHEHPCKDVAAVSTSLLFVERAMRQHLAQVGTRKMPAEVVVQRIFPSLKTVLRTRLLCFLGACHVERVTGVEPAPAHWMYADQDLKSCVLPLHYTRSIFWVQKYELLFVAPNIWLENINLYLAMVFLPLLMTMPL